MKKDELKPLSASRVKSLENCSWLYWCSYHLKLPQLKNEGASKGDICHWIFELFLKKNRISHFNKILLRDSVTACPSVERLIKRYIKQVKLHDTTEGFLHIDQMVLVGFKSDFFVKGGVLVAPEFKFDLTSEQPRFRIKGFIDKLYIRDKKIVIDDFKSSKRKFAGEDQESNLQALFYSLAVSKLWPNLTPTVRFIFLQYPQSPIMEVNFTSGALLGFQHYLAAAQLKIEGFNEFVAKSHFAFDSPSVPDEFKGKLLCGFATHPEQLKKDGTKMWHCPYKFAFDYYAIKQKSEVVAAAFTLEELRPLEKGERIEKCHYDGCPRHINPLNDIKTPIRPIGHQNVLDDF